MSSNIKLTLDEYIERVITHCRQFEADPPWFVAVVQPWLMDVAPVKTQEYGIDCWKRLGSRGLMVDISACYYRWEQLREKGTDGPSLDNALVDLFGYSAMYCVCVAEERSLPAYRYEPHHEYQHFSPHQLNEWMIAHVWETTYDNRRVQNVSRTVATQLAKRAWEEYH